MSQNEAPADLRSEQAKTAIIAAARSILEESGTVDGVTLKRIAEETHYATSVVHYHTGGIEPLKDELFQHIAMEYVLTLFLGESHPLADQPGHEVILAAGSWIKAHPASARFLATRKPSEVREPAVSGAKAVFGIDLEADPDGLSVTRYMQRALLNPVELILDSEEGARSIDDETVVALGLLSWRHLRSSLSILASRPMGQGALAPKAWPKPGITAPVPFRSDDVGVLDADEMIEARHTLMGDGADALSPDVRGALHAEICRDLWRGVLERGTFDEEGAHHLLLWLSAYPGAARFLLFDPGRSGVPVDRDSLEAIVPGLCAPDERLDGVSFLLSRTLSGAAEVVSYVTDEADSIGVLREAVDGARRSLLAAGWAE